MEEFVRECFLVTLLDGLHQVDEKLVLSLRGKCGVDVPVGLEGTVRCDKILGKLACVLRTEGAGKHTFVARWQIPAFRK